MTLKDIVVFVDPAPESDRRLLIAADLARRYAAHLVGVYVVPENAGHRPSDGFVRGKVATASVIQRYQAARARAAILAGQRFAEVVERQGIQAEFRLIWNREADPGVNVNSLYADLLIIGSKKPHGLPQNWLPKHLLATGVPVLVVPDSWTSNTIGTRIIIAWNASKEARRAVADALPLLSAAQSVVVLVVNPGDGAQRHGEEPGANIALHISRHGGRVDVHCVDSDGLPVAEVILSSASEHNADLIVMGAYSHSRTLEMLFGSVTRAVLTKTSVPVLVSR